MVGNRSTRHWADSVALALGLTAVFAAIYAVVARYALDAFPYSGDEYSLVLQSELFAKGLLKVAAPEHVQWLRIDHVVIDQFVRSKYPPGGPALLAIGVRHGYAWLVTPLEGGITLAIVWHTVRRVLGARPALVALVTLGAAPLFMFDAASFYMHTPTLMFLALAFAAVAQWTRSEGLVWLVITGAAIGCAFLIRPIDALLFGVAMLVFRSPRAVIVPALCAMPFVALSLWYQKQLFGGWFTDGYHAYHATFVALYGESSGQNPIGPQHLFSPIQQWHHLDIFGQMALQWTVPGTVIAALFGAPAIGKEHPARRLRTFSIAIIVVFCVALLAMVSDPDDGPHPRYLTPTLIPLALLAAAGFEPLCVAIASKFGRRIQLVFVSCAVLFGLAQFGSYLQDRIPKVWKREGLYQVANDLPYGAIVIVRAQYPSRFARNGPFFTGPLYLSASATTTPVEVAEAYPDRPIYEAHEGIPWTIERVR